jgi:hypothetical protein
MENGFIVNIMNTTAILQEIKLFSGELPEGILVQTLDNNYDFDGLQMAAQVKPFNGNSLTTNTDEALKICIVNMGKEEIIILNGRYEGPKIVIDGNNNFIKVDCPPNVKFYIRLLSIRLNWTIL